MIHKPLSVQSDWTDCNSHGTTAVPSHAEMEGNWIEGINVPQHCLTATCCTQECMGYGVSARAPVYMESGIDPSCISYQTHIIRSVLV